MDGINHIQNVWMQIRSSFKSYTKNGFENEKRTQRKVNDIKTFELRHFRRMCIVVICQSRLDSSTLYFFLLGWEFMQWRCPQYAEVPTVKTIFF